MKIYPLITLLEAVALNPFPFEQIILAPKEAAAITEGSSVAIGII